jgi:hypothetical protein
MSANDPAMLQFPGLLAAVVNDALRDGVPLPAIVAALELTKTELIFSALREEAAAPAAPKAEAPLIIPFGGHVPGGSR